MNKAFDTPVETKPENRRYDNRNHQKQEKQYKDEDISKLKNRPGRFIKPAPQPVEQKKESTEPKKLPLPEMISISDLAERDRKSTRLNSSHSGESRMPSSA